MSKQCRHTEGSFTRDGQTWVDKHDCAYVDARNRLIPTAERLTKQRMDELQERGLRGVWSEMVFQVMDELWNKTFA